MTKGKKSSKEKEKKISLAKILTLIIVLLFSIFLKNHLCPKNEITQAQLDISSWPLSAKKHLEMAKAYFNHGDEKKAVAELKKAESLYHSLAFLDIKRNVKQQLEETKTLLSQPEKVRQDINYWETVLKSKPHYRDVFLRLSVLNYQLYQHEKFQEYWEKAFYLDPNNEVVQKLGEKIGVANFSSQ